MVREPEHTDLIKAAIGDNCRLTASIIEDDPVILRITVYKKEGFASIAGSKSTFLYG